ACSGDKVQKKEDGKIQLSDTLLKTMNIGVTKITQVKSELKLTGKVVANQNNVLEVFPLVGGTVKELSVELGDYVQKGQVLAVFRSGEVADYEKQLTSAQSNLQVAKKNLQVTQDLFDAKLVTEKEMITAKGDLKNAESDLNKINEIFKIYGIGKESEYVVKAPISGFIVEKNINRDMQLRADNGDNIFTISQLDDVWVLANVYETDINRIKQNDTVFVSIIAYPEKIFKATIDKVYDVLDPVTRVMKIRIKLANPGYLLKPEMYANVTVNYSEPIQMATISSSALVFDNSTNYVLVYKNDKDIRIQKVDVFKTIANKAYIRSGLKEGDKVITSQQLLIYNALNQ
ncbi:MAG TPA: efflux RND transporter periplasmic adaptor subunit, partial [Nitrosopumilaceae archaeon]|nr:efflux RND transporter periplasmic adaptor subunit [Nitrosopumilaceae archaeon]